MRSPDIFILRWVLVSLTSEIAALGRRLCEAGINFIGRHPNGLGLFVGRLLQPLIFCLRVLARWSGRLNLSLRRRWDASSRDL